MLGTAPTDHDHSVTSMRFWPLLQIQPEFAPSVRERKKNSDSLAGICMEQAPGGLGTQYLLFFREPQHSLYTSVWRRAHHPPHLFFWHSQKKTLPKKPILNKNSPGSSKKVRRRQKASFAIKGLRPTC